MSYAHLWQVPEYFTSGIQSAISDTSVHNGDTVSVWVHYAPPDTYYENINFEGKNIMVVNRSYITNTGYSPNPKWIVVSGQDSASVVSFSSGETQSAILKGFTIQNGLGTVYGQYNYRYGGGIFCLNASPQIIMNRITANTIFGLGGGIAISGASAHPKICQDTIDNNSAGMFGGGIYYDSFADPEIDSNYIYGNGRNTSGGGGIYGYNDIQPNSQLGKIYANKIKGNIAYHGFAVYFTNATPILRCNEFAENYGDSSENVIVCYCSVGQSAFPDFGSSNDLGLNIFKDTAGRFILYNGSSPVLYSIGNYWKSVNTPVLHNRIHGNIDFDPIAASDRIASVRYNSACSTDVIITGDLTINQNVTLNIASGKTFKFTTTADTNTGNYNSCELLVHGSLQALGTEEDKITFTSNATSPQANDWYGIRLRPNSVGKFNNCNVKYGYCGIEAISNDTLLVDSSLIESNQTYGINISQTQSAEIKESEFNGSVYGIKSTSTSPIIANNKFESNASYGIFLEETDDAMILKNYINGLSDAPTLYGIGLAEAGENVYIDSNRIEKWNQAGIYINKESYAQVNKDTIIDNTSYGILCSNSSSPKVRWCQIENNGTGVYCEGNAFPDLGTDSGYNSIDSDNDYYVVNTSETYENVYALNNWWGTEEPNPDKFIGLVKYNPWLSAPPEDGEQSAGIINTTYPFILYAPKPNPASKDVKIVYSLPTQCKTELVIYNAMGRVITKVIEEKEAGRYEYLWNSREYPNGVYIIRLKANDKLGTQKVVISK
jgi:hypothetical protein